MKVLDQAQGNHWHLYNADCVTFAQGLPDNSVDFTVYSPPFSSLYVYGESVADMGNVATDEEFIEQYRYLVKEKLRITRPGRLSAIHVKDLVYYQNSSADGSAGLRPFSDMCTQLHIEEGWTFHCRITIFRDPVLERAKTNAHGLLWKTFQTDATFCRVGMPEYVLVFRKWAKDTQDEQVQPVTHPKANVPLLVWQDLASPIWQSDESVINAPYGTVWNWREGQSGRGDADLPATNTLNVKAARDEKAEKHLCPMPLNITSRCLELWTNEGDVIFSPFTGVGSEGVAALNMKRRFIGTELNPPYYRQAIRNLQDVNNQGVQESLFS